MQDKWYSDKRDVLKWSVLLKIGEQINAKRILQVAYFRPCEFPQIEIDKAKYKIPVEVLTHFRNVRSINRLSSKIQIEVLDKIFDNREEYLEYVIALIDKYSGERSIIFLDPDTGLEPSKHGFEHVRNAEAAVIWKVIKKGDVFAVYQHQTNRHGQEWIEPKRDQLATALCIEKEMIKVAQSKELANDVVIYFVMR